MSKTTSLRTSLAVSYQPTEFSAVLFAGCLSAGLQAAAQAGFSAVEISMRDPTIIDLQTLEKELRICGLLLSAIATGQSYLHDKLYLYSPIRAQRDGAVHRVKSFIEIAANFQAFVIIGGIRGTLLSDPQKVISQRQYGLAALRECVDYAASLGVTLLLEPINRYETNLVNTAQEGLSLLREVGATNIKLLMDTFHMNIEERDFNEALDLIKGHLGYIHFADSNRQAPGAGHIPFYEITEKLHSIGYNGYISAEILPLPDDITATKLAGEYLHTLLSRNS